MNQERTLTVFKACKEHKHDRCKGVYYEGAPYEWRCICECHYKVSNDQDIALRGRLSSAGPRRDG